MSDEKGILVKAIKLGFYEHARRKEGAHFRLIPRVITREVSTKQPDGSIRKEMKQFTLTAEQQFSPKWMVRVEEGAAAAPAVAPPPFVPGAPLSSVQPAVPAALAPQAPPPLPPPPPPAAPAAAPAVAPAGGAATGDKTVI